MADLSDELYRGNLTLHGVKLIRIITDPENGCVTLKLDGFSIYAFGPTDDNDSSKPPRVKEMTDEESSVYEARRIINRIMGHG